MKAVITEGKTVIKFSANRTIFCQADPADLCSASAAEKVKLAVTSKQGKEGIVAPLDAGEFFGGGCLAGQPSRVSAAIATTAASAILALPAPENP